MTAEPLNDALLRQLMRPSDGRDMPERIDLDTPQREAIAQAMRKLNPQHREILELRYTDGEPSTYEEIAEAFKVSPLIVRTIETGALNLLREHLPPSRADIATSATRQYVAIPAPAKTHAAFPKKIDCTEVFQYLDAFPQTDLKGLTQRFHFSRATASRIKRQWQAQHIAAPSMSTRERAHAYLDQHPTASLSQLAQHLGITSAGVVGYRKAWQAQRQPPPQPDAIAQPDIHIQLFHGSETQSEPGVGRQTMTSVKTSDQDRLLGYRAASVNIQHSATTALALLSYVVDNLTDVREQRTYDEIAHLLHAAKDCIQDIRSEALGARLGEK